jgi:hypothetical protein
LKHINKQEKVKNTNIFVIIDAISKVEIDTGKKFTAEEKAQMIRKALEADLNLTKKKRHKQ